MSAWNMHRLWDKRTEGLQSRVQVAQDQNQMQNQLERNRLNQDQRQFNASRSFANRQLDVNQEQFGITNQTRRRGQNLGFAMGGGFGLGGGGTSMPSLPNFGLGEEGGEEDPLHPKLFAYGGLIEGPPPPAPGVDNIPIQAQAGEYVLPPEVVEAIGIENLDMLVEQVTGEPPVHGGLPTPEGVGGFDAGGMPGYFEIMNSLRRQQPNTPPPPPRLQQPSNFFGGLPTEPPMVEPNFQRPPPPPPRLQQPSNFFGGLPTEPPTVEPNFQRPPPPPRLQQPGNFFGALPTEPPTVEPNFQRPPPLDQQVTGEPPVHGGSPTPEGLAEFKIGGMPSYFEIMNSLRRQQPNTPPPLDQPEPINASEPRQTSRQRQRSSRPNPANAFEPRQTSRQRQRVSRPTPTPEGQPGFSISRSEGHQAPTAPRQQPNTPQQPAPRQPITMDQFRAGAQGGQTRTPWQQLGGFGNNTIETQWAPYGDGVQAHFRGGRNPTFLEQNHPGGHPSYLEALRTRAMGARTPQDMDEAIDQYVAYMLSPQGQYEMALRQAEAGQAEAAAAEWQRKQALIKQVAGNSFQEGETVAIPLSIENAIRMYDPRLLATQQMLEDNRAPDDFRR